MNVRKIKLYFSILFFITPISASTYLGEFDLEDKDVRQGVAKAIQGKNWGEPSFIQDKNRRVYRLVAAVSREYDLPNLVMFSSPSTFLRTEEITTKRFKACTAQATSNNHIGHSPSSRMIDNLDIDYWEITSKKIDVLEPHALYNIQYIGLSNELAKIEIVGEN